MDCNKEEARRAIKIAERKLTEHDYNGAKRFASKAKTLYPTLEGLDQISAMVHVYISASNKTESDWYGILSVDPLADEDALKKQYKKLALLLHPDKNRFDGAEGAFKLVLDAWSLLSDKGKRVAYDQKRKRKEANEKKSEPKPPASPARENPKRAERRFQKQEKRTRQEPAGKEKEASSKKKKVSSTFWTMCTHCSTYSEHVRAYYLDKTSLCPFCHGVFVATEKFPEMVNGKPFIRFAPPRTFWTTCTHCSTYSEHVRADHLDKSSPCPFCHGVFVATEKFPEMVNGKPFIRFAPPPRKPQATTSGSTSDTRNSMPKTPCSRFDDLNSTHEAYRLFSRSGRTSAR